MIKILEENHSDEPEHIASIIKRVIKQIEEIYEKNAKKHSYLRRKRQESYHDKIGSAKRLKQSKYSPMKEDEKYRRQHKVGN